MSVNMRPFRLSDLLHLRVQSRHLAISPILWRQGLGLRRIIGPWSWTAELAGSPVAACGILDNAYAWALLGEGLGRTMIPVIRTTRNALVSHVIVRGPVYAHIDGDHPEAVRWARLLGFAPCEGITWRFG